MATGVEFRTLTTMTTYLPPLIVTAEPVGRTARREGRTARWLSKRADGKLQLIAGVESLAGCPKADLVALASAADLVDVPQGTVLGEGRDLGHFWWMPLDGWLLLSGHGNQAVTIPSGWSWMAPDRQVPANARLTALRGGRLLTAATPSLLGAMDEHPRLAQAIGATLVTNVNV